MMTILGALTALASLAMAIFKYFPAKSPERQAAEERGSDVAKIHEDSEKFKKSRDTSDLGNID